MSSMQFWGVEVKPGESHTFQPEENFVLHVSQAALGELKKDKGSQSVSLYLKHGTNKLAIGTLSHEKIPQISLDLVLESEFELSHTWKDGSVCFSGYKLRISDEEDSDEDSDSDFESEELFPVVTDNGKPEAKETKPEDAKKPDTAAAKQKVNFVEPNKDVKPETEQAEDSDDDEDYGDDDDDSSDDQGLNVNGGDDDSDEEDDDSDDDSDESQDEDDRTPKKAEPSKKRSADSATKTPVPDKKVKLNTPQKTDAKKVGGHTATPHPAKAGKTLANSAQTKQQAQKSGGSYSCKSCNRSFGTEMALQSHTKAKHGAAA